MFGKSRKCEAGKIYQGKYRYQFIAEERLRRTKSDCDIVVRTCEFPRAKLRPSLYVALMSNVCRVKCNSNNIDN